MHTKETVNAMKQPLEWEKVIANETTDKELISTVYKQLVELNTRRFLRVPWTTRKSNQSILKEISPEYSWEGLILKMKL